MRRASAPFLPGFPPDSREPPAQELHVSDLSDNIQTNAGGPKKASRDGESAEQHSLPDQIAADKYLRSREATRSRGRGVQITKMKPPGAT